MFTNSTKVQRGPSGAWSQPRHAVEQPARAKSGSADFGGTLATVAAGGFASRFRGELKARMKRKHPGFRRVHSGIGVDMWLNVVNISIGS